LLGGCNMKQIVDEDALYKIDGGLSLSGSLINAFTDGIETIMNVGRSLGTAIRRIISGNLCDVC